MSPRKSLADRWNWAERQVLAVHWKIPMASWFLEFQRTDFSALWAPHLLPRPSKVPLSAPLGPGILASGFLPKHRLRCSVLRTLENPPWLKPCSDLTSLAEML